MSERKTTSSTTTTTRRAEGWSTDPRTRRVCPCEGERGKGGGEPGRASDVGWTQGAGLTVAGRKAREARRRGGRPSQGQDRGERQEGTEREEQARAEPSARCARGAKTSACLPAVASRATGEGRRPVGSS